MIAVQVELPLKTASFALTDLAEQVEIGGTGATALDRLETQLVNVGTTNPELHGLFVYGPDGSWLATSLSRPVQGNNSDRDYFRYHQNSTDRGVHVGAPVKSRSTDVWIIPVSRRINRPDGSFNGVALVTLRVNFFERIYDELNVGETGTVLSEQASRSADVAARYGGEEFAVILPGTDNAGAVPVLREASTPPWGTRILQRLA